MTTPDENGAEAPEDAESPFEATIQSFEEALETNYGAGIGRNPRKSLQILRGLAATSRFGLESIISKFALISLNEAEYDRLQAKMRALIAENLRRGREQGMQLD